MQHTNIIITVPGRSGLQYNNIILYYYVLRGGGGPRRVCDGVVFARLYSAAVHHTHTHYYYHRIM